MSYLRVNRISKVDRWRIARQRDYFSHRRETVDFFRIKVDFQAAQKLARVADIAARIYELTQPAELFFIVGDAGLSLLVLTVSLDSLLRDPVHILGSDLNLKRLPILANDRCVQRLVEIWPGDGDVIFDAAGNRFPKIVQDS